MSDTNKSETVTISRKRYENLVSYEYDGLALASGGVDNWEWYGDSFSVFEDEEGSVDEWLEAREKEDVL